MDSWEPDPRVRGVKTEPVPSRRRDGKSRTKELDRGDGARVRRKPRNRDGERAPRAPASNVEVLGAAAQSEPARSRRARGDQFHGATAATPDRYLRTRAMDPYDRRPRTKTDGYVRPDVDQDHARRREQRAAAKRGKGRRQEQSPGCGGRCAVSKDHSAARQRPRHKEGREADKERKYLYVKSRLIDGWRVLGSSNVIEDVDWGDNHERPVPGERVEDIMEHWTKARGALEPDGFGRSPRPHDHVIPVSGRHGERFPGADGDRQQAPLSHRSGAPGHSHRSMGGENIRSEPIGSRRSPRHSDRRRHPDRHVSDYDLPVPYSYRSAGDVPRSARNKPVEPRSHHHLRAEPDDYDAVVRDSFGHAGHDEGGGHPYGRRHPIPAAAPGSSSSRGWHVPPDSGVPSRRHSQQQRQPQQPHPDHTPGALSSWAQPDGQASPGGEDRQNREPVGSHVHPTRRSYYSGSSRGSSKTCSHAAAATLSPGSAREPADATGQPEEPISQNAGQLNAAKLRRLDEVLNGHDAVRNVNKLLFDDDDFDYGATFKLFCSESSDCSEDDGHAAVRKARTDGSLVRSHQPLDRRRPSSGSGSKGHAAGDRKTSSTGSTRLTGSTRPPGSGTPARNSAAGKPRSSGKATARPKKKS